MLPFGQFGSVLLRNSAVFLTPLFSSYYNITHVKMYKWCRVHGIYIGHLNVTCHNLVAIQQHIKQNTISKRTLSMCSLTEQFVIIGDWGMHCRGPARLLLNVQNSEWNAVWMKCLFLCQIMLVDGYKGQKVQDVKKPIQKMMVEKVRNSLVLMQESP